MAVLLGALVLLVLASPLDDLAGASRLVIVASTVAFLLACLQQARYHPRLRLPARLMVMLWLALNLPLARPESMWMTGAAAAVLAALNLGVLSLVAQRLLQADRVDSELLCSALGGYLLLGAFWAETYEVIGLMAPAAFSGPAGQTFGQSTLLYFSFTTLTTTGYGDVTAVNPLVRMWAVFEAIVGTMYNATVIARLVALYGSVLKRDE